MTRVHTARRIALATIAVVLSLTMLAAAPAFAQQIDEGESAIINGTDVAPGEFPHLVLGSISVNGLSGFCGGSLVAPEWVLTAAHCTFGFPASSWTVNLGALDRTAPAETIAATEIIVHPAYNPDTPIATGSIDMALVKLERPANLAHPEIGLIGLNTDPALPALGDAVTVAGYGDTDPSRTSRVYLDEAQKSTIAVTDCSEWRSSAQPNRICALPPVDSGGCPGDSGGPLMIRTERTPLLVGTVEGGNTALAPPGFDCGRNVFNIYQRVSTSVEWIQSHIGVQDLCAGRPVEHYVTPGVPFVGTPGPDVILGTSGDDDIKGGGGNDTICSLEGNDLIDAGAGDDVVDAGLGVDKIKGRDGSDLIIGGGGSDRIWGGEGDDEIQAGSGADRVWAGDGNDIVNGMGGKDTLYGQGGDDTMQGNSQSDLMYGGPGADTIRGAAGKDRIYGGNGHDKMYGGTNTDFLDGGNGNDLADGQKGKDNPLVPNVSGCIAETKVSC